MKAAGRGRASSDIRCGGMLTYWQQRFNDGVKPAIHSPISRNRDVAAAKSPLLSLSKFSLGAYQQNVRAGV